MLVDLYGDLSHLYPQLQLQTFYFKCLSNIPQKNTLLVKTCKQTSTVEAIQRLLKLWTTLTQLDSGIRMNILQRMKEISGINIASFLNRLFTALLLLLLKKKSDYPLQKVASFSNSNVLSKLKERHSNPSTLPVINRSRRLSFDSNHQEYTLERILNGQKKTRTKDLIHVYIIRDLIYISKDKSHQTDRQQLRWVATMLASTLNRMWSCLLKWGLHVPGCMCLFHVQSVGLAEGSI